MKRNILMFGCIIVCLILVSLSYQPIIAEKQVIELKEEITIVEYEDCECSNSEHPIFCKLLEKTIGIRLFIYVFFGFWLMHIVLQLPIGTVNNLWSNYNERTLYIEDIYLEYCTDYPEEF